MEATVLFGGGGAGRGSHYVPEELRQKMINEYLNSIYGAHGIGYNTRAVYIDENIAEKERKTGENMNGIHLDNWKSKLNIPERKIKKIIFSGKKTIVIFNPTWFNDKETKVVLTRNDDDMYFISDEDLVMFAVIKNNVGAKVWSVISKIPIPDTAKDQRRYVNELANTFLLKQKAKDYRREIKHIFYELSDKDRDAIIKLQKPKVTGK